MPTNGTFGEALEVCALDPVGSVAAASRIIAALESPVGNSGQLWRWPETGPMEALVWAGGNLVLVAPDGKLSPEALEFFVAKAKTWGPRCSSIVGRAELVLPFWRELKKYWQNPREVRENQPLLIKKYAAISGAKDIIPDPEVQPTAPDEIELMLPASIAMFTEEMGFSPLRYGANAYRELVASRIAAGHSFRRIEGGRVIFKAEVGVVAGGVAQLQGIWIAPDFRGRGLAKPAIKAVVQQIQTNIAPTVSLYVNLSNSKALKIYRDLGFEQIGIFATVLY